VDWRQCAAVTQKEVVTVIQICSGVIFTPVTIVRVLKESFFRMVGQLQGLSEKFMDLPYYSVYIFEKWVERCISALLAKGGTLKKRPSVHLHEVSAWSNESTKFSNGPLCSAILKRVLLKRQ
jgi:hypothetical protein